MFHDTVDFAGARQLESLHGLIQDELARLAPDEFLPWPETGGYDGSWLTFPLFLPRYMQSFGNVDTTPFGRRCPRLVRALRDAGVEGAGFSWQEPGSRVMPHSDEKPPHVLRALLGLRTPKGARIRVVDRVVPWEEGRCLLFDGYLEHETLNEAPTPRVIFMADIPMSAEEQRINRRVFEEITGLPEPERLPLGYRYRRTRADCRAT